MLPDDDRRGERSWFRRHFREFENRVGVTRGRADPAAPHPDARGVDTSAVRTSRRSRARANASRRPGRSRPLGLRSATASSNPSCRCRGDLEPSPRSAILAMVAQPHDDRHLEAFLAECVHESLNNYMISNAVFLCERLYAACPNEVRPRPDPPLPGPLGTPPPSTRAIPPLTPPRPPLTVTRRLTRTSSRRATTATIRRTALTTSSAAPRPPVVATSSRGVATI